MSVRTELKELVEWISELTAMAEEGTPPPEVVWREVWQDVRDDLSDVSERFGFARTLLLKEDPKSVLAELAGDLQREAESLSLRAHMLSRRAPPEPKSEAERKAEEERNAEEARKAKAERARKQRMTSEERKDEEEGKAEEKRNAEEKRQAKEEKRQNKEMAKGVDENVKLAGGTLERAHAKLEIVKHPDAVTQRFEEEMDVLAEMTLSLRLHCERAADEPKKPHNPPPSQGTVRRVLDRFRNARTQGAHG